MKSYKRFKEENTTCKAGEYFCNTDQKCKPIPSGYKVDEDGMLMKEEPRVPRKSGQPAGSKKHSDLYTDENPKDTVSIKFKSAQDIKDTLSKASFKSKKHARKSQIIVRSQLCIDLSDIDNIKYILVLVLGNALVT